MKLRTGLLLSASIVLAACGGSGGTRVASTPTPVVTPPPPPPPASQAVTIFATPTVGEYASVGASAAGSGGYESTRVPIGAISTSGADQPRIRFTADGTYEVQLSNGAYDRLIPYGNGTLDSVLTMATNPRANQLVISESRNDGYRYSELATWTSDPLDRFGAFAFGVPTPQGAMPLTRSATYIGTATGETDIFEFDFLAGAYFRNSVEGSVSLDFDFGSGSLAGSMSLSLEGYRSPTSLGTFSFSDTIYSSGSTTYSGRFVTTAAGQNVFLGRFTGPNAEETIGAWALPFTFNGDSHQALGAWIAKRGN